MDTIAMDRDLRTVRVAVREARLPHRTRGCTCTPHRHHRFTQRLTEVLTLSACLLSLVQWPTAMSAPTHTGGIPADAPRLWVDPCGFSPQQVSSEENNSDPNIMAITDEQLLDAIILQVKNAIASVDEFKINYVMETFNVDYANNHNNWKTHQYEWLLQREKVPKGLGELTREDHLMKLKLDDFLRDSYRLLQVIAVALEQVTWDHNSANSKFYLNFLKVQYDLKMVLCEIEMALNERRVDRHPDVDRDVMPQAFRDIKDNTKRHVRDWLIFRDYMIVLEYVKDVYKYFVDNPARRGKSAL